MMGSTNIPDNISSILKKEYDSADFEFDYGLLTEIVSIERESQFLKDRSQQINKIKNLIEKSL